MSDLVNREVFELLNLGAPSWYLNPTFKPALDSVYNELVTQSPLILAPGLEDILSCPDPPSASFFLTLPAVPQDAVY